MEDLPRGGSFVTLGGVRFFYRDVQQSDAGEPVLLLSGLGFSSWCWDESIDALSKHWRVVTLDNRGSGRSDKPPGPYTIEQMAEDAVGVLDALGLASTHVVGNSMGGYIALLLALRYPERVRSLVLVNTSSGGDAPPPFPKRRRTLGAPRRRSVRASTPKSPTRIASRPDGSTRTPTANARSSID